MPDLVTHFAAAYFFKYISNYLIKNRHLFYLGTILPDIVTRPFYILFPNIYWFVFPLHTFFGIFLFCLLLSFLFENRLRIAVFFGLYSGCLLHFMLDLLQKDFFLEYYWFYPFSKVHISMNLFAIDASIKIMPLCGLLILLVELEILYRKVQKKRWQWALKKSPTERG